MTQNATLDKPIPLPQRLRKAREEAGVTVAALARQLGVDPRTVAGWQAERPRSRPSYERLREIAAILGKPVSYFVDEKIAA